MSIETVFIVLLYSAQPYWWLILLLVAIPLACYWIKPRDFVLNNSLMSIISVIVGVAVALAAPRITTSELRYVATLADWGTLIAIMLGAALYCRVSLALLFKN